MFFKIPRKYVAFGGQLYNVNLSELVFDKGDKRNGSFYRLHIKISVCMIFNLLDKSEFVLKINADFVFIFDEYIVHIMLLRKG